MRRLLLFSGLLFFLAFPASSRAHFTGRGHVDEISRKLQAFLNTDCGKTNTCDLKRFTLISIAYEVWFKDDPIYPTHGNGVIIEYETDSVDSLEKYAVVQFIRGGIFYSKKNSDGKVEKSIGTVILSFGDMAPFFFPEWVIDSRDFDPVYNSDPDDGRFFYLRWNKVSGSYELKSQAYYGNEKPKQPVVYLTDYPGGAFVAGGGSVQNAAMQFKTCLYRASDVPQKTARNDIDFAKPLACFEWQNFNIYDFGTGKFKPDPVDIAVLYKELMAN